MVSPVECVTNELGDDKVQERKTPEGEIHAEQPISHNGLEASQPGQEHATPVEDPKKPPVLDIVVHSLDKDNGGNLSRESDKTPKVEGIKPIASSRPGANAYVIPEKVPEDGYNWRKYGQKFVKGNEFVRSYYKCTHLHCHVKKQLERSHDGRIKDMVYFGEHDHPKPMDHGPVEKEKSSNAQSHTPRQNRLALIPQPLPLPATPTEELKAPPQSNKSSSEVGTADDPSSKKRKKENNNADETPVEKPSHDMRTVVRTLSEVDLVNDGYRWRKYGQKLVKGSPHPRSYYRCSSPACPVKKHVERASHDNKMVITTYEGRHDHDLPPSRTVIPNAAGPNFHTTAQKEETGSRSEGNDSARQKMVSHPGSYPHPENISNAQLNGESRAKLEVSRHDIKEVAVATSVPVSRSDEVEVDGIKSESNKA